MKMLRMMPILCAFLAALAAGVLLTACSGSPAASVDTQSVSAPAIPLNPDLTTPEKAVVSYLDWSTFAYRMVNSELASKTAEPTETVRIDSYIELNKEQGGKALDQHLAEFSVRSISVEATKAVVATHESWKYRYFSITTLKYLDAEHVTSYDTTYTLVNTPEIGWRVDKVDAQPLGEVF